MKLTAAMKGHVSEVAKVENLVLCTCNGTSIEHLVSFDKFKTVVRTCSGWYIGDKV